MTKKEYRVCSICFSSSPNCLGECACSYGDAPLVSLNESQLDAIYLLRDNFNISIKKSNVEKVYQLK